MTKAALVYLAMIVIVTGLITGLPMDLISLGAVDDAKASASGAKSGEETAAAMIPALAPSQDPEEARSLTDLVSTSGMQSAGLTRNEAGGQPSAAISLSAAVKKVGPAGTLAKPIVRGGADGLDQTTAAILSDLALIEGSGMDPETAELQAMSTAALSGLRALRGNKTPAAEATLEALVAQALREGQNDGYIDALVNEAAGKGQISVPSALVTADGRVDTAVLLSSLVAQAQVASGTIKQVKPQDVVATGKGVERLIVNKAAGGSETHQFYTVLPGDSLGAIAVKFYGDVTHYSAIYNANRAILASPDRLNVGQRLVIPAV
jgi:LysM repeat protein